MLERLKFPAGFLWGSATSSYQVEGGIDNNDWAEAARTGRVLAAGRACDSYNRYPEDFDIARSLGHNVHRFSIEWARIEPEEGKFNQEAIEHYRKVLESLREYGLKPFVTLWHFTLPVWFARLGGFENKKAPFYFARYCEYVVSRLGEYAKFWITINEPMVYVGHGYIRGVWPPFRKNFFTAAKVVDNLIASHNVAYKKIKLASVHVLVGIAADQTVYYSNKNPFNIFLANFLNWFRNHRFLDKINKCQDFIGVNYYRPVQYGVSHNFEKINMGSETWEIHAKGIYELLMQLKCFRRPVYITENGIPDAGDTKRAKFIKDHLYWVNRAMHDGIDLRGYFYWSLLDNFEWAQGFEPRFGLVEMDYKTMERKIRPSAYEYKKICESNSLGGYLK